MAWQIPQSQTTAGITVNLGMTDDVFVANGVTLASTGNDTIQGIGNNHEVLIYGTVAVSAPILASAVRLGGNPTNFGQLVTIKPGGHVQSLDSNQSGLAIFGFDSKIINEGLISAVGGFGIQIFGTNAATQSEIINSGTIDAG